MEVYPTPSRAYYSSGKGRRSSSRTGMEWVCGNQQNEWKLTYYLAWFHSEDVSAYEPLCSDIAQEYEKSEQNQVIHETQYQSLHFIQHTPFHITRYEKSRSKQQKQQ